MAKKITYLLGAGASANTIPIVSNMNKRIEEITKILGIYNKANNNSDESVNFLLPNKLKRGNEFYVLLQSYEKTIGKIIAYLNKLKYEASKHYTIDTLARKYFLKGKLTDLLELKRGLVTYFTLEQFLFIPSNPDEKNYPFYKDEFDKRYDSFIAAIAKRENENLILNENISILSWNYDMQFELSLKNYVESNNINLLKNVYNIYPNIHYDKHKRVFSNDNFNIVKLNGTANWELNPDGEHTPVPIFDIEIPNTIMNNKSLEHSVFLHRLGAYVEYYQDAFLQTNDRIDPVHIFNFAWENDPNFKGKHQDYYNNLERAELIASETEILVVIGYSFPIFNREIDNRLFKKMDKLEKVYVQDIDPENIKSTMENAFEVLQKTEPYGQFRGGVAEDRPLVKFHLTKNINQFVIPYELNQD